MEDQGIIDRLYGLVSSPDKYDDFMLELQQKLTLMSSDGDRERASFLQSHMQRAASLVDVVTPWRRDTDDELHAALRARLQATIAVDLSNRILDANSAAKVAYDLAPNSSTNALPLSEPDRAKLEAQILAVIKTQGRVNNRGEVVSLRNVNTGRLILLTLDTFDNAASGDIVAIVKTSDIVWPNHLGPILRDLFDLTRAEIEVVRLMVEGARVNDIAERRNTSKTTVRSQLKAIFAKTETATQMECVRLVLGLAMLHDVDEGQMVAARLQAGEATAYFPRDEQRMVVDLPDGRQLEYSTFGAKKGACVLFHHDQAFGDVWFKEAVDQAVRLGLRIIAPLRPGFGHTTIYKGEASEPRDFAPDIRWLLDYAGVEVAAQIALSSGLVHALAAAELMPDRLTSITACHPLLPVIEDADLEGTNGYNYLIPHTRLHFPSAVRFLCKAGFAFVTASGPAAFGKAVMRASPWDVNWLMAPENLPVLEMGRKAHRVQGYVGNYGDIAYRGDWRDLLRNAPCPVRLVIGEHDRNVQWAAAQRWSDELDHVELHVMRDAGYMVFHQQSSQVLKWARSDLSHALQSR